ncbi:MAG TPA: PBP1A family penicillin-binding protein [Gemmatimonadaceae bacterium]|nr:PBP1A family penicillin-binding protein [Gemmatimonadaceae bacterium]
MATSSTRSSSAAGSGNGRRRGGLRLGRILLLALTFLVTAGAGFAYGSWATICNAGRCPSVEVLDDYTPSQTSKLYAADGRFIAEIGHERRTVMKLGDIPQVVRDAFVVTEDKRFYDHAGIDWVRVFGAVAANLSSRSWSEGFSTISMQLTRNIFPERISREKTLIRKLKEAKVARAIEARYPKDKILELYLNQIYLGNGAHGVEAASQRYFGKSVRDLNVAEAAMLAALPKAPERYNPRRYPERAVQRRNTIVELMRRESVINDADASLAQAYPLRLASRIESGDVAPYYVEWVRSQLDARFGRRLYEQGLKVYTTLDVDLQSAAERALENQLKAVESGRYGAYRHTTYEQYIARSSSADVKAGTSPYLQGAFVALDPRTGAVRALVGGRDFGDSKFNRATQALRQPGSTFKPVVVAAALQNGRPPSYVVSDDPLAVPMGDGSEWTPQNYDLASAGQIPMRQALYQSRNIATVRLGIELGEGTVIEMAKRLGITTPIPQYPSIFLGAAEVYPIEMIAAYSAFATLGNRATPYAILRVENMRGEVLWTPTPTQVPALSAEEAWLMVDMMKDVVRRGTAAGSVGAQFRIPAGGKTGTTNDGTDVWYIGYTSDLVAGVWMGFDKPQKIKSNAQGGQLAAPAWTAFMKDVYRRKPAPPDWPQPSGIVQATVDRTTGLLAGPYCPTDAIMTEFYIAGTEPPRPCDIHTPYSMYPDTMGTGGYYPPSTMPQIPPPATPMPSTVLPRDTIPVLVPRDGDPRPLPPGAVNPARPVPRDRSSRDVGPPLPRDTAPRPRPTDPALPSPQW